MIYHLRNALRKTNTERFVLQNTASFLKDLGVSESKNIEILIKYSKIKKTPLLKPQLWNF